MKKTKNGSVIQPSDGPVKPCPCCGHWIRITMLACGESKEKKR